MNKQDSGVTLCPLPTWATRINAKWKSLAVVLSTFLFISLFFLLFSLKQQCNQCTKEATAQCANMLIYADITTENIPFLASLAAYLGNNVLTIINNNNNNKSLPIHPAPIHPLSGCNYVILVRYWPVEFCSLQCIRNGP